MSKYNIPTKTAGRLGIKDGVIIQKAEEFLRTFHLKTSLRTLNDDAKSIFCLELASDSLGQTFDKETALKLSGLKKSAYVTNFHLVEKVLGLDAVSTVSDVSVKLCCSEVRDLAEEIFDKYKSNSKYKDVNLPHYVTAAVYTACKLKKVKIDKPKFVQISRLKPVQWRELTLEFEKFVGAFGICSSKKQQNAELKTIIEIQGNEKQFEVLNKETVEVEDYVVWKKRILDESYEALERHENSGNLFTGDKVTGH